MIFILRLIIFSAFILLGFQLSIRSNALRKIVTAIYTFALLWYTFLCRIQFTTTVYGDDTVSTSAKPASASFIEQIGRVVVAIFGAQPDGTLAGAGLAKAMAFNILLFIPLGYLLLLWFTKIKWWQALIICVAVSVTIETLQSITGLGMADFYDILGNSIGGLIGVGMAAGIVYRRELGK